MDEVAFVESLFAPEMRSAVASSVSAFVPASSPRHLPLVLSPPSLESLQAMGIATPPTSGTNKLLFSNRLGTSSSTGVPPPPNSLLGGGILTNAMAQYQAQQQPFQPGAEDQPLFVRLHDDDVFTQLLADQDFDFHSAQDRKEDKPPTSTNSLLLEPLDLPRSSELKDAFVNATEQQMQFQQYRSSTLNRGGILASSSPPNSGFGLDSMMPVFPLSTGPAYYGNAGCNGYPPLSPASNGWLQDQDVSTPGNCSFQRVHMAPMSMKHMMAMSMSSPMVQQQPSSSGSMDMFSQAMASSSQHPTPSPSPLWISACRVSPPEPPLAGDRKEAKSPPVARPPFSMAISPPASLTSRDVKALKELIVSADYSSPHTPSGALMSRPKRPRSSKEETNPRAKSARTTSVSPIGQENSSQRANAKVTKGKKCIEPDCTRRAQSNSRCKAHGGGARCQYSGPGGCNRSSQGGGFCRAHGGGKRCEFPGCQRGQQRKGRCYVHGGIRRCQFGSCEKKDRGNGYCISHGGGKRCQHPGCSRAVRRGTLCQVHEAQQAAEKINGEETLLL